MAVWGASEVAAYYARPDLTLLNISRQPKDLSNINYVLLHTRHNADLMAELDGEALFEVWQGEARLAVLLRLDN